MGANGQGWRWGAWLLAVALCGACAKDDLYRGYGQRLAYEIGDQVARSRVEFETLWRWYLDSVDARAPTAEIEVCLTITPAGQVSDAYIGASTIRRTEFVRGVLDIYQRMRFAAREVEELTICDEPLLFLSRADVDALAAGGERAEELNLLLGRNPAGAFGRPAEAR